MPCLIWNLEHSKSLAIFARWHMMVYRGISFLPMVVKRVVKSQITPNILPDILNAQCYSCKHYITEQKIFHYFFLFTTEGFKARSDTPHQNFEVFQRALPLPDGNPNIAKKTCCQDFLIALTISSPCSMIIHTNHTARRQSYGCTKRKIWDN